jgi:hypothetical protein
MIFCAMKIRTAISFERRCDNRITGLSWTNRFWIIMVIMIIRTIILLTTKMVRNGGGGCRQQPPEKEEEEPATTVTAAVAAIEAGHRRSRGGGISRSPSLSRPLPDHNTMPRPTNANEFLRDEVPYRASFRAALRYPYNGFVVDETVLDNNDHHHHEKESAMPHHLRYYV